MKCSKGVLHDGAHKIAHELHQVNVPFLNQSLCDKEYGRDINNQVMFCAGSANHDSCDVLSSTRTRLVETSELAG